MPVVPSGYVFLCNDVTRIIQRAIWSVIHLVIYDLWRHETDRITNLTSGAFPYSDVNRLV